MNMLIGFGIGCPYRWLIKIRYVLPIPRDDRPRDETAWPGKGEERLRGTGRTSVGSYFADINEIEISMEITARYLVDLSGARSPSQTEVGDSSSYTRRTRVLPSLSAALINS